MQFVCTVITGRYVLCLRNTSSSAFLLYKNIPNLVVFIQVYKCVPDRSAGIQSGEDSCCGLRVFWQAVCTHFGFHTSNGVSDCTTR